MTVPLDSPLEPLLSVAPRPRHFGLVNGRGLWSLIRRELLRFWRFGWETLGGAAVSSLLFLLVFHLALGGSDAAVPALTLTQFIAPGLVVFALTHSAYESAAAALLFDKLEGMIGDVVGAPLTPLETVLAYAAAAALNGLTTGAVILVLMSLFVALPVASLAAALIFALLPAVLFGLVGLVVGLWADRWDGYAAAETFAILPLALLSGAFFPLEHVPSGARWLLELNPVFHAIEGFRWALTGYSQGGALWTSALVLAALILVLGALAWRLFAVGYKIKP